MKKKIVISHIWSGVGEQFVTILTHWNIISEIKKMFPNEYYFIWNIYSDNKISTTEMLTSCYNVDAFKSIADEFYISNDDYKIQILQNNPQFCQLGTTSFFCSIDCDIDIIKSITQQSNNIITFGHPNEGDISNIDSKNVNIHYPELLNRELYDTVDNFLKTNGVDEYEVIHFRSAPRSDHTDQDTKQIINYWLNRVEPLINPNKKYVLASNSKMFFDMFNERYKTGIYLDRELSFYEKWEQVRVNPDLLQKPKIIPSHLFTDKNNYRGMQAAIKFSNYIAYLEQALLCKSKQNIHISDGERDMISLFMSYPTLVKSVPVIWVAFNNVLYREYSTNGCYLHNNMTNLNNKEAIKIPSILCKHSYGILCETYET